MEQRRQWGLLALHERPGPVRLTRPATRSASAVFCSEMARISFSSCAMAEGMQDEPSLETNVPGGQAACMQQQQISMVMQP